MLIGSNISFCDKRAFNIIDINQKKQILDLLKNDFFISIKDKNFYIINKKNINYIEKQPYIISVKTIGSLYYLFLTKIDNKNYCFYIDKKIKDGHEYPRILSVLYRFDDSLYNNTLFEGELLRNNNNEWLFVINNFILHNGIILKNKNIIHKLNIVYDILTNYYSKDPHLEICPLYVKRLFSYHEWDYLINEYLPNLDFKYKGLYLENTKINKNYLFMFNRNNINKSHNNKNHNNSNYNKNNNNNKNHNNSNYNKNNNKKNYYDKVNEDENKYVNDKNTKVEDDKIIFNVRKTDISDIYDLYCLKDNQYYKYDIALVNTLKISKKLNKLFTNSISELSFECEYNKSNNKWIPQCQTNKNINTLEDVNLVIKTKS